MHLIEICKWEKNQINKKKSLSCEGSIKLTQSVVGISQQVAREPISLQKGSPPLPLHKIRGLGGVAGGEVEEDEYHTVDKAHHFGVSWQPFRGRLVH